jgi:hypothetical protein
MRRFYFTSLNSGIFVLVLFLFVGSSRLISVFCSNLAEVILNQTLWQSGANAVERQEKLLLSAELFEIAERMPVSLPNGKSELEDNACSMIPAIVLADYHRKQGEIDQAIYWLRRAAEAPPTPSVQDAILIPGSFSVSSNGDLGVDLYMMRWALRKDSQPANPIIRNGDKGITLSYENKPGHRDWVYYYWPAMTKLSYWTSIKLKIRVHPGSFFTFETHGPSGMKRHINYFRGDGVWREFTFPLTEDSLRFVYMSLSEPGDMGTGVDSEEIIYMVDVESLSFLFDENVCGGQP